ncbi:Hypothetical protein MVR_LOCUS324 [uncultured virus]|nr:Hypothetical protein MVR_LOCUS324 [uncultured virus]
MQVSVNYKCVLITPTGEFKEHVITLTPSLSTDSSRAALIDHMQDQNCSYYTGKVAKAIYPFESYCYAFFESVAETPNYSPNPIATQISNNIYSYDDTDKSCPDGICVYGNYYVVHVDYFGAIFDLSPKGFVQLYNRYHTLHGSAIRICSNRITDDPNVPGTTYDAGDEDDCDAEEANDCDTEDVDDCDTEPNPTPSMQQ